MRYKLIGSESTGTFLVNPSVQTLQEIQENSHTLAKATFAVFADDDFNEDQPLYTVKISEYFEQKLTELNPVQFVEQPTYRDDFTDEEFDEYTAAVDACAAANIAAINANNTAPQFHTENGPLQTQITITCPGSYSEVQDKLGALRDHLRGAFYACHPYASLGNEQSEKGYGYGSITVLRIKGMTALFADTIWEGLQSSKGFKVPAGLIAELKMRTYQRAYVPSEAAIYNNIRWLISDDKCTAAVDAAYAVASKKNQFGMSDMTSDVLYQTGVWLKDRNLAEANRAFRLVLENDMHCMQPYAKKQLTQVAAAKLSEPTLYGAPRVAWARSVLNTGFTGTGTSTADRDTYLEAAKTVLTKDGAFEMSSAPGAAEFSHALHQNLDALKAQDFSGNTASGFELDANNPTDVDFGMSLMMSVFKAAFDPAVIAAAEAAYNAPAAGATTAVADEDEDQDDDRSHHSGSPKPAA